MKPLGRILLAGALLGMVLPAVAQRGGQRENNDSRKKGDMRIGRKDNLSVGAAAPDFTLKTKEGDKEVQLSSFKDKQPVFLVFGSYT